MQHYTRPRVNIDDNDDVCIISDASSTTCGQWPYLCFLVGTSLTTRHLAGRLHLIVWHRDGRAEIYSQSRGKHITFRFNEEQPSLPLLHLCGWPLPILFVCCPLNPEIWRQTGPYEWLSISAKEPGVWLCEYLCNFNIWNFWVMARYVQINYRLILALELRDNNYNLIILWHQFVAGTSITNTNVYSWLQNFKKRNITWLCCCYMNEKTSLEKFHKSSNTIKSDYRHLCILIYM